MKKLPHLLMLSALAVSLVKAAPLGTAFTYQGRLTDGANPAQGIYDLRFAICDSAGGGSVLGVLTNAATPVTNGLFTVTLDFGADVFNGDARWLEIGVRAGTNDFTVLNPRQALTPVPYALQAAAATQMPAANLTGTIADAQLSTNVALLDGGATFAGVVAAASFTGNGAGVTNVQATNLAGTLPEMNLDNATWLQIKAANMASYRNWKLGGLTNTQFTFQQKQQLRILFEGTGLEQAGKTIDCMTNLTNVVPVAGYFNAVHGNLYPGSRSSWSSGCTEHAKDAYFYDDYFSLDSNGNYVTFSSDGFPYNVAEIDFACETNGTTFKIQTNNGASFVDVGGYAFSSQSNFLGSFSVFWTNSVITNTTDVRVVSTGTGTNRPVQFSFWNNTVTNGVIYGLHAQSSSHPYTELLSSNVMSGLFSNWNPTLLVWSSAEDMNNIWGVTNLIPFFRANCRNADIIIGGQYPTPDWFVANLDGIENTIYLDVAQANGAAYFDGYSPFENYTNWVNRGFDGSSLPHASSAGYAAYGYLLAEFIKYNLFYEVAASSLSGDGSGLTNLNASALATGTLPDARLSTNVVLQSSSDVTNVLGNTNYWYWNACSVPPGSGSPTPSDVQYLLVSTNNCTNWSLVQPQPIWEDPDLMTNLNGPNPCNPSVIQHNNMLWMVTDRYFFVGNGVISLDGSSDQVHWQKVANLAPFGSVFTNAVIEDPSWFQDPVSGSNYIVMGLQTNFFVNGTPQWGACDIWLMRALDDTFTNWTTPVLIKSQDSGACYGPKMFYQNGLYYLLDNIQTTDNIFCSASVSGPFVHTAWNLPESGDDTSVLLLNSNLWLCFHSVNGTYTSTNSGTNWTSQPDSLYSDCPVLASYYLNSVAGMYRLTAPLTNVTKVLTQATNTVFNGPVSTPNLDSGDIHANAIYVNKLFFNAPLSTINQQPVGIFNSLKGGDGLTVFSTAPGMVNSLAWGENVTVNAEDSVGFGYSLQNNGSLSFVFNGDDSGSILTSSTYGLFWVNTPYGIKFSGSTVQVDSISGDGGGLTSLNASSLASGTVSPSLLPTNAVQYVVAYSDSYDFTRLWMTNAGAGVYNGFWLTNAGSGALTNGDEGMVDYEGYIEITNAAHADLDSDVLAYALSQDDWLYAANTGWYDVNNNLLSGMTSAFPITGTTTNYSTVVLSGTFYGTFVGDATPTSVGLVASNAAAAVCGNSLSRYLKSAQSLAIITNVYQIYTNGEVQTVYLVHPDGSEGFYGTNGAAVINAWAAASYGDRIEVGSGTYDIGDPYFTPIGGVTISGVSPQIGFDGTNKTVIGGTILKGALWVTRPYVTVRHLAVTNNTGYGVVLDDVYDRMEDVVTWVKEHAFLLQGNNLVASHITCLNYPLCYALVIKNSQNVMVKDYYSWNCSIPIWVKASGGLVCSNIVVDGAILDSSTGSGNIMCMDANSLMANVYLRNIVSINSSYTNEAFALDTDINCMISNFEISDSVFNASKLFAFQPHNASFSYTQGVTNFVTVNCQLTALSAVAPWNSSISNSAGGFKAYHCLTPAGMVNEIGTNITVLY